MKGTNWYVWIVIIRLKSKKNSTLKQKINKGDNKMLKKIKNACRKMKSEEGQAMVEYGLIIALVAIAVIAALIILGPKIAGLFTNVSNNI